MELIMHGNIASIYSETSLKSSDPKRVYKTLTSKIV
jgi:hypothetical protein